MPTECSRELFGFEPVEGRPVVAAFDGGQDHLGCRRAAAGGRGPGDRADRAASPAASPTGAVRSWSSTRSRRWSVQRVFGIALGYEDLVDHDELRHDPVLAVLAGKLAARRKDCAPLAGKSTLNRLEHAPSSAPTRYHKIGHDRRRSRGCSSICSSRRTAQPPEQIILDLDATDDPLHGHQEGPLLPRLLRLLLLSAALRLLRPASAGGQAAALEHRRRAGAVEEVARIVGQIRARWPRVRIVLRADSGFARDELMSWCEANGVDYVLRPGPQRAAGRPRSRPSSPRPRPEPCATGQPARRFKDFTWRTLDSWSRERRVVGQGRVDRRRGQPALHRHLAGRRRDRRPASSTRRSTAPAARWRTGSRSASSTCSPTAPRRRPCAPTSCGCGSRRWPTCCSCALRRIGLAAHPVRRRHLRHDPPEAVEDRRAGADQRAPHQDRDGLRLPLPRRVPPRLSLLEARAAF